MEGTSVAIAPGLTRYPLLLLRGRGGYSARLPRVWNLFTRHGIATWINQVKLSTSVT